MRCFCSFISKNWHNQCRQGKYLRQSQQETQCHPFPSSPLHLHFPQKAHSKTYHTKLCSNIQRHSRSNAYIQVRTRVFSIAKQHMARQTRSIRSQDSHDTPNDYEDKTSIADIRAPGVGWKETAYEEEGGEFRCAED